jgi:pimeloyl-ACP methyl ester carboxylesterase
MPFYPSRGARLHYEVAGEGPPVLLVHGFTNFGQVWGPQIAALVHSGYQAIVPDLAGHGLSSGAEGDTDVPALAVDMVTLLDALGVGRALVCGLSLGGMIAQQMAVDHPNRVSGILVAASRADNAGMRPAVESWITEFEGPGGALSRLAKTYPVLLNEAYRNSPAGAATFALWQLVLAKVSGRALATVARGMLNFDVAARLPAVQTRSLIVSGEHDRLIAPALTRRIASLIPGAAYAEIAAGGHICSVDSAAAFTPLLLEFASAGA